MPALPYLNTPLTTIQDMVNQAIANINASGGTFSGLVSGTAIAGAVTAQGTKLQITSEALVTAAAATYTLTITDAAISASSSVFVAVNYGTANAGEPGVHRVQPLAGSVVINIRNDAAAAAFNGTLIINVLVVN